MSKKIFIALLFVMCASCAFANVTPQQAISDPRIGPYVVYTKQNGAALLPGRYMHTKELDPLAGGQKILAPTNLIVEIKTMADLNPNQKTYYVNADLWGEDEMASMYMLLDITGEVPILKTYLADEGGNYETVAEDFAVVLADTEKRIWCLASVETGEVRYMCPLDNAWFPKNWHLGNWKASDSNTSYTFSDNGLASMNGQAIGKFIVSDNRIVITRRDGSKELICAWWNPDTSRLVLTFVNDENMTAGAFTRAAAQTKTTPNPADIFKRPSKSEPQVPSTQVPSTQSTSPQMPSEFPEMPNVQMPKPPAVNIEGVWGAYYNNQQLITQFKGNQYFGWINGQPSEMGMIQIEGNVITGKNNHGVEFTATLELSDDGKSLTMTFMNGNTLNYQRLQ